MQFKKLSDNAENLLEELCRVNQAKSFKKARKTLSKKLKKHAT